MTTPATILDHDWIGRHIPHQGAMNLLERVTAWDAQRIRCEAINHRDADHPLRAGGRLGCAIGIEYAAQAMAVHGALLAPADAPPQVGYIASVRDVAFFADRLDDAGEPLDIVAERVSGDDTVLLYAFKVCAHGRCLLRGRASVVLDAERRVSAPPGR